MTKLVMPFWPKPFGRKVRGQLIAIVGTDGSGKSTSHENLNVLLQKFGYRPKYVYMGRARGNLVVSDAIKDKVGELHNRSDAHRLRLKYIASWVYVFDYLARFVKIAYLSRIRGETILCDRYFYDIRLMDRYSRFGYWILSALAIKPDILVVLDCSVETLMARKAERTPEEYQQQREYFLGLLSTERVGCWKGTFRTDQVDSENITEAIANLAHRASHRRYDY